MILCKPLKKRTIFLIMVFVGFALNFLLRNLVQMALLVYGFRNFTSKGAMEDKAVVQFYYGYLALLIPCGRLSELFGGKTLVGFGILGASILSLLIPYAIHIGGYESLVIINGCLGAFLAPVNSAIFNLASKWIPVEERGKFVSSMSSLPLGNALVMMLTLHLNHSSSKEIIFIIPGVFGIIWTLCWYMLVYDSPLTHPSITRQERNYIVLKRESQGTIYEVINCPWFEISFDSNVWVVITTHTCFWAAGLFLQNRSSIYLQDTFKLNPLKEPFLMMLPHILGFLSAFMSGFLFDFLYSIRVPLTVMQKCFTIISTFLPASALVGFITCQESMFWTLFFYVFGISTLSWALGGHYTSFLDKAPNFAATLTGISATVASIGLILTVKVMNILDVGLDKQQQWENRHSLISALLFTSGTMFALFGNSNIADWNTPYEYEAV